MLTFTDSAGTEWTVFEVRRQTSEEGGRWSYLPEGFAAGWLCFESIEGKRRLVQFPAAWRQSTDAELDALCRVATLVTRPISTQIPAVDPDALAERSTGLGS